MSVDPGTPLGPYEILSLLGAGGMGEVYRARDPRLGRDVAIKTIAPHLSGDAEALNRFQREARTIASLSHPSILAIYDVGSHDGVWYLVTELLEGMTVGQRLTRGPIPWARAVEIAKAVADGLAVAHAHGVIHRDLKPDNVFVTTDDRVKILDFGLARRLPSVASDADDETQARPTDPGAILGTIGYMSPEQLQGRTPDARSDIFSLGCVLHEMIGGRRLFKGGSAQACRPRSITSWRTVSRRIASGDSSRRATWRSRSGRSAAPRADGSRRRGGVRWPCCRSSTSAPIPRTNSSRTA
jgi:serine/threonine protein kinase